MQEKTLAQLDKGFFGHPKALKGLFFTELWERFSYYGIRPLLILYMTAMVSQGGLGLTTENASAIVGLFAGSMYLFALVGGWLADEWLGQERAVWYGSTLIALGHLSIGLSAVFSNSFFYLGLVFIVIGSGLFKTCISVIVGSLYSQEDERRDAGFSIFYMGINLGALVSPLITGILLKNHGWHIGFAAGGLGMLVALIIFRLNAIPQVEQFNQVRGFGRTFKTKTTPSAKKVKKITLFFTVILCAVIFAVQSGLLVVNAVLMSQYLMGLILVFVLAYFGYLLFFRGLNGKEKTQLIICLILFVGAAFFWAIFEQQSTSLNLFAQDYTDLQVGSFTMPAVWFQSINSLFVIFFAPVFGWLWVYLGRRNCEPGYLAKFSMALVLAAIGFAIMVFAAQIVLKQGGVVSPFWLVGCLLFLTFGELSLSPVGLSAMTKLAPEGLGGQMLGLFMTSVALGNLVAGMIGGHVSGDNLKDLPPLFTGCIVALLVGAVILWFLRKPMVRLVNANESTEIK